jgi:hypothetical protein
MPPDFSFSIIQAESCIFALSGFRLLSPTYDLLGGWSYMGEPPYQANQLKWGFANIFPKMALTCHAPNVCLLSSWDYRQAHCTCLVFSLMETLEQGVMLHSRPMYLKVQASSVLKMI